jgi:hypothetical protein
MRSLNASPAVRCVLTCDPRVPNRDSGATFSVFFFFFFFFSSVSLCPRGDCTADQEKKKEKSKSKPDRRSRREWLMMRMQ